MRISTPQIFQQNLAAMLDQQDKLSYTQQQMASGRRILTPADDPAGAARVIDLNQSLAAAKQYGANADAAQARLSVTESTLGGIGDLLQRIRELTLQANNATQSNETRATIAAELRGRLEELVAQANTRDANGEYLFAGYSSQNQPFARTGTVFVYNGDDGSRRLQIGPSTEVAVSDSGRALFQQIHNGNGTFATAENPANTGSGVIDAGSVTDPSAWIPDTYTITFTSAAGDYEVRNSASVLVASGTHTNGGSIAFNGVTVRIDGTPASADRFTVSASVNQDLFTTVQNIVTALETPVTDQAARVRLNNTLGRGLTDLDQGMGRMLEARTALGARLNVVDTQKNLGEGLKLVLEQTLSETQDLDYAEAISRLNRQMLALQAAQQSFVKIQDLSLFNFIR